MDLFDIVTPLLWISLFISILAAVWGVRKRSIFILGNLGTHFRDHIPLSHVFHRHASTHYSIGSIDHCRMGWI